VNRVPRASMPRSAVADTNGFSGCPIAILAGPGGAFRRLPKDRCRRMTA
jgi:hypothetical protein